MQGLGVTGSPDVGVRFPTIEHGVRAHLGHLLSYYGDHGPWCAWNARPLGRHFGVGWTIGTGERAVMTDLDGHLHLRNDASELDGRWAVPGVGYGERVSALAARIA